MVLVRSIRRAGLLSLSVTSVMLVVAACGDDDTDGDAESGDGDSEASVALVVAEEGDGGEVTAPVDLEMTAEGVTIEEAGAVRPDAGHFHVMVDVGCVTPGEAIPDDESHHHFGDGSASAELDLDPGEHELCLQLGDGAHTALDVTDTMTVTVAD